MIDVNVVNISDLRDFGRYLQNFGSEMYNSMLQAQQKLYTVSDGWHDENNELFKSHFEESVNQVKRIADIFAEYNHYIQRICAPLDDYASIRM